MKIKLLFGMAFVLVMSSCGQKGPLYLPQPQKPAPEAAKPAPAAKQDTSGN
jgi:predicted small lipoprotein YifL